MTADVLTKTITRRQVALGTAAGAAALTLLPARALVAAQATPAVAFASLGYPELKVTITDTGYEGIPATLPAGRYLLTATTKAPAQGSPNQQPPTVAFLSPTPAGMRAADLLQLLGSGGGGTPEAGGTPGAAGTPAAGGEQGGEEAPRRWPSIR